MPEQCGITTIESIPSQVLSGTIVGVSSMAQCSVCARSIGEASRVALRAHCLSDECRWTVAQILCESCTETHGTIQQATAGATELVLAGRLVLRGDCSQQEHRLAFDADDGRDALLDYSLAEDGEQP